MPSNKLYIGIDSGAHGAIVELPSGNSPYCYPLVGRERRQIVGHLRQWLSRYLEQDIVACIEDPGTSIFGAAKGSVCLLNRSFAELRMACVAVFGSEPRVVLPKEWIRWFGIPARKKGESKTHWKKRLADLARKKFPGVTVAADCADAMLIAYYCRETGKKEE